MKICRLCIPALVCLAVLSGCGKNQGESAPNVAFAELEEVAPSGTEVSGRLESDATGAAGLGSAGTAEPGASGAGGTGTSESGAKGAEESGVTGGGDAALSEGEVSEAARAAYGAFLEGDISLFDSEDVSLWGLEDWEGIFLSVGGLEYACLDLDGDGIEELLVQFADDPGSYNGVFHYGDGRIFVWQFDGMEMSCRDYPLQDGTMVRQYDYSGSSAYTLFRYKNNGETEALSSLFCRQELLDSDSDEPCPYYEVDGEEVDEADFEERLKMLVTDRMLERGAWTEF